jgi:hypothetical protein
MSIEIRTKNGKLVGKISDSMDEDDFLIVNNKRVPLSDVYQNKELKDSFNDSIKSKDLNDDE